MVKTHRAGQLHFRPNNTAKEMPLQDSGKLTFMYGCPLTYLGIYSTSACRPSGRESSVMLSAIEMDGSSSYCRVEPWG